LSESFRVVVALLTPFRDGGEIDTDALARHVELLGDAGVDGVMPCGTTGEGPLLTDREVLDVTATTIEHARGRLRVIAHVGRPATSATAELAREALDLGADAVAAVVPYYYSLGDDEVARHYEALLAAVDGRNVYAYTIPARAGNDLSPAVVRRLAASGLRGVKDSTKSWSRHEEYLACGVEVFIGTDALVAESRRAGGSGCVSALANVRPELFVRAREGDDVQAEISELRSQLPFPRLKRALARRLPGYPTSYRAPLA
jgi:4-hydroxy-tetrahydrodipicolinate synthase